MPRTWTAAQRLDAAQRIRTHQPWQKSTGPKTSAGKNIVKMNACRHGRRSAAAIAEHRAAVQYLRRQRNFLKQVRLLLRIQRQIEKTLKSTNELIAGKDLLTLRFVIPSFCHSGAGRNPYRRPTTSIGPQPTPG